jgi:hypothetical protein
MTYYNSIMEEENPLSHDCVICFENIDINNTYIKCCNCEKLFHKKCIDKWKEKKKQTILSCPSCTTPNLLVHQFITHRDFCCFKIKKKKINKKISDYN